MMFSTTRYDDGYSDIYAIGVESELKEIPSPNP